MEQIAQTTINAALPRSKAALRLPPLLILVILLLLLTAVILATRTVGETASGLSDPFTAMHNFFPGQPGSALDGQGFKCATPYYAENPPNLNCMLWPTDGDFFQVKVLVSQNMIAFSEFQIRGSSLRIGDLMLLWGESKIRQSGHQIYLSWYSRYTLATAYSNSGVVTLFLPVRTVYITDNPAKWFVTMPNSGAFGT